MQNFQYKNIREFSVSQVEKELCMGMQYNILSPV